MKTFQQIGTEIGGTVEVKNAAYGSSFATAGPALRLLFPQGIPAARLDDALLLARMWDKMQRIATDRDAFGESPFLDLAGYAILGAHMHQPQEDSCVTANDAPRPLQETAPASSASSAAPDAAAPTTTTVNEPSAQPSPQLSTPKSPDASRIASGRVAIVELLRAGNVEGALGLARWRNKKWECAFCKERLPLKTRYSADVHGQRFDVCGFLHVIDLQALFGEASA